MIAWLRSKFHRPAVYCASCEQAVATMTSYDETPICQPCAIELASVIAGRASVRTRYASSIKTRVR